MGPKRLLTLDRSLPTVPLVIGQLARAALSGFGAHNRLVHSSKENLIRSPLRRKRDRSALHGPHQTRWPARSRPANFLDEMEPRDRYSRSALGSWRPGRDPGRGRDSAGSALRNSLGTCSLPASQRRRSRSQSRRRLRPSIGILPGPRQRRPSALAGLGERPSGTLHLLGGERAHMAPAGSSR